MKIGVGLVINGESVHGFLHPEGGHVPIQPLPDDNFDGYSWGSNSPFKGKSTVEGMTSSVALTERLEIMTGKKDLLRSSLVELEDDHEIWNHAANALANLSVTLILTTSIEKIVFGGGVMNRNGMIEKIRKRTIELLNGYLELPDISSMITLSSYGADVGLTGAILLAQQAIESENGERKSKKSFITPPFMAGICHGIIVGAGVAFLGMIMLRAIKK
jgi:fructokinase